MLKSDLTSDPRDPSFSWPVTRMTRDPDYGMSRLRLLTTIAFSSLQ